MNKIVESSSRMRRLIDELLNFSRTSRSNQKYERTDLQQLLETLISDFEMIISEKNATITYDKLPTIEAIPIQMEQSLHNMISNALKFSRRDIEPVITIAVSTPSEGELISYGLDSFIPHVEIKITDNGIGFAPEYAEQIFDIFQRLNYKQDYPGTGIGLALCRKIVSNHRGKIIAEGVENGGAEFHVILPTIQTSNQF